MTEIPRSSLQVEKDKLLGEIAAASDMVEINRIWAARRSLLDLDSTPKDWEEVLDALSKRIRVLSGNDYPHLDHADKLEEEAKKKLEEKTPEE